MTYIKKSEYVEAFRVTAALRADICKWINRGFDGNISQASHTSYVAAWFYESNGDAEFYLNTKQGAIVVSEGDVVYQVHGEHVFQVLPFEEFEEQYQSVGGDLPAYYTGAITSKDLREALIEVLDSLGFMSGGDHELTGHGISEERAAEIRRLVT